MVDMNMWIFPSAISIIENSIMMSRFSQGTSYMDLRCCAIFMKKVSHLYQCVQDTLMNNTNHVGSLVICSEPTNMRIHMFYRVLDHFFGQFQKQISQKTLCKYQIAFQITSNVCLVTITIYIYMQTLNFFQGYAPKQIYPRWPP